MLPRHVYLLFRVPLWPQPQALEPMFKGFRLNHALFVRKVTPAML
jgi:hypothetical protein